LSLIDWIYSKASALRRERRQMNTQLHMGCSTIISVVI